jgi:uncharacterized protein YihD (DUF1040 family)
MHKKGATIILGVMIISTIILVIASSMTMINITVAKNSDHFSYSTELDINMEGCAEEALLKLARKSDYSGETLALDDTICLISVTGEDPDRTIVIEAVNSDYTQKTEVDVTINPAVNIMSWYKQNI